MPTTVQQIIDRAQAKSMKNRPGVVATDSELVDIALVAQRNLFALAARVNPTFFGDELDVAYAAPGWARPVDAESIHRIELVGAIVETEIKVVPHDDRLADRFHPSVYRFGQVFRSVGRAIDPETTDSLRFFYSKRPTDPVDMTSTLDAMWPTQYDELLALEVAMYLCLKDSAEQRGAELGELRGMRDASLRQFIAFLEHETANLVRRHSQFRRINTETVMPINSLVAGGTSVIGA